MAPTVKGCVQICWSQGLYKYMPKQGPKRTTKNVHMSRHKSPRAGTNASSIPPHPIPDLLAPTWPASVVSNVFRPSRRRVDTWHLSRRYRELDPLYVSPCPYPVCDVAERLDPFARYAAHPDETGERRLIHLGSPDVSASLLARILFTA